MPTTYEDLPNELRAMILKYRTVLRKDAAIIIFRNLARNSIAKRLSGFLEWEVKLTLQYVLPDKYEDIPNSIECWAFADKYSGDPFAAYTVWLNIDGGKLDIHCNSFFSDIRNLKITYNKETVHWGEDDEYVDLTGIVRDAHSFPYEPVSNFAVSNSNGVADI